MIVRGILALLILPLVLGVCGYVISAKIDRSLNPFVDPEYRIAVESRVNGQQLEIANTRNYVQQHMNFLGRQIGSLQAQLSRIHAVENRISETAGIDLSDFNYEGDPPIGGSDAALEAESQQVDIENAINEIERELSLRESEIAAVDFLLSQRSLQSQQTPAGWPVEGGWVSSDFGSRMHPITGKKQFHSGVDIPGKTGSAILAVADGVVERSEINGDYGWLIQIDHGDGYKTLYSHNRANLVKAGETVTKGQAIAELGSTGISTGPHVHFEVSKDGSSINPVNYLYKKT